MFRMTAGDSKDNTSLAGGGGKWWICILLLLATLLNYLDRQVLSLTADKLIAEFHIDKEGFGWILASFRYPYALAQVFGGWIVDSLGPRSVFPAAVGLWSTAGLLTGFAPSLGILSMCRCILGTGEAFNWPCALKTTERLLDDRDRPLANGVFNSGTALGSMIAPVVVTVLAARWGWRSPFIFAGALGGIWVVLWLASTRSYSVRLGGTPMAAREVVRVLIAIASKRAFWLLATTAVVVNSANYFLADWIPLYLKTERGFSFGAGNMLTVLIYAGLDAGNLLAGAFVRTATRRGVPVDQARNLALLISCILMTCAVLAGVTGSRYLALVCIILTAMGVAGFLVLYLTLVQDLDPLHVGAAAGMLGGLGNLVYGVVSPYIGRLADLHQTSLTFTCMGLLPWLAYLSISRVKREEPERT